MPDADQETPLHLRRPTCGDAASIWRLVEESGVLDRNSSYLYLLLCRDFSQTCVVAERASKVVGFVTGYRCPSNPEVLFIWQIGVCPSARRQGLGISMLNALIQQMDEGPSVRFIEATISPSNVASRRLFEVLASRLEAPLTQQLGFAPSDFPGGNHEAEPRIRIGPLDQGTLSR